MIKDLEIDDMILLINEEGRILYTVVFNDRMEEWLFIYSVRLINGEKVEVVKDLYYSYIINQCQYIIVKRDGIT